MILVDANLLIYAKGADFPQHRGAASWLESVLSADSRAGLPWASLLAFLRVSTNPRVLSRPLTMVQAWAQVDEWLRLPGVWIPQPTDQHPKVLGEVLSASNAAGNLVSDAHVAALALEHGLEVFTTDSDYARFPGVRWRNPLVEGVREGAARYRSRRRAPASSRARRGIA